MSDFRPNPGDILLKNYEIVSLVGEGAFGSVYKAKQTKLDRLVAIKFLNAVNEMQARFQDELDAIKSLDHPNIVRLYDYDILKGGIPCFVMEFIDGRELGDVLASEGPFDCQYICEIALQALDALVETHRKNIVHCDLKPENIMLTNVGARKNVVKLIDFGVASILKGTGNDASRTGMLIGTPQYMAPEQILNKPIGPWTDIYALGLIMVELFTGKFVFDHEDPREVLKMQLYQQVEIPHDLACTALGPIVSRAIQKDPERRYRNTQEVYDDIKEASFTIQNIARNRGRKLATHRRSLRQSIFADINDLIRSDENGGKILFPPESVKIHDSTQKRTNTENSQIRDVPDDIQHLLDDDSSAASNTNPNNIDALDSAQTLSLNANSVGQKRAIEIKNPGKAEFSGVNSAYGRNLVSTSNDALTESEENWPKKSKKQSFSGSHPVVFAVILVVLGLSIVSVASIHISESKQYREFLTSSNQMDHLAAEQLQPPKTPQQPFVLYSTIRDTAAMMAYVAAISGHLGVAQSPSAYRTFSVIGTPTDASIYVNSRLVCVRTPCKINVAGSIEKTVVEIRKGARSESRTLDKTNEKNATIMLVLSE